MPVDPERFKRVLGSWASGVTIVTSSHREHVHGMTVSAFCSVSLDPMLVLVCADKTSNTQALIERARVFSVSLLAAEQEALSNRFASKKDEDRRFEGLACETGATGCPRIPGALGYLDWKPATPGLSSTFARDTTHSPSERRWRRPLRRETDRATRRSAEGLAERRPVA
jgi:flavin reductase (DIM6/NTAB) family NADH-FMN oxidoreductase RutF